MECTRTHDAPFRALGRSPPAWPRSAPTVVLGMGADAGAATAPTGAGASGSVASIAGTTMEVQSATEGQTSVSWTPDHDVLRDGHRDPERGDVGDCLTVTGTPSKKSKTTVAARSITISQATSSGTCAAGFGGAGAGGARFGGGAAGSGRPVRR